MCSNWDSTAQHSQIAKNVYTLVNFIKLRVLNVHLLVLGCRPFFHLALGLAPFFLFLCIRISSFQNICLYNINSLRYAGGGICSKMWQAGIVQHIKVPDPLRCSLAKYCTPSWFLINYIEGWGINMYQETQR